MRRTKPIDIKEAIWWEEQCVRRQGGYDLDQSNLPSTLKWLPKGTILKLSDNEGKAIAVKTALVVENATKSATTLKIKSGSLFKVGDTIAGKTISAISTANGVDTLTVAELGDALKKDDVVSDYDKTKDVLLGFSYDTIDVNDDNQVAATPTLQVMEVEEDSLPYPINADIKEGLNANGIALFKIQ